MMAAAGLVFPSCLQVESAKELSRCISLSGGRQRRRRSLTVVAGSKEGSSGIFAPLVVVARSMLGTKRFNQLRGKGIALHSQVITEFCKSVGADNKVRQGLIRVAKKNGEKLGFLA